MEKVVYLLGAGFSAPLGLPVMRDFLIKANDLHSIEPKKFSHFAEVFSRIQKMHIAKSYYEADLMNIEEILSILEMSERIDGSKAEFFTRFLCDVVVGYTPQVPKPDLSSANWYEGFAGGNWNPYFAFVMSLMRLQLNAETFDDSGHKKTRLVGRITEKPNAEYGVVSLNYDQVLERMAECFNDALILGGSFKNGVEKVQFITDETATSDKIAKVFLAKLHGCVSTGTIIAPTWNKGLAPEMVDTWRKARELLADANQIRIIGYSLPITDAYIKYLLKAAVIDSGNLKRIDVLCLDPTGHVATRYNDFITFNFFRFASKTTESYLGYLASKITKDIGNRAALYDTLETAHEEFFRAHDRARGESNR